MHPAFSALLLAFLFRSHAADKSDDIANGYRLTIYPHHPIKGDLTGFGYLGYVYNPDKDNSSYYLGYPGLNYKVNHWLQIQGGMYTFYNDHHHSSDTLELRPFIGPKFIFPNRWKWNIYNYARLEYRDTLDLQTHLWSDTFRLRSRFGVEFPFANRERAWRRHTWYGMADVEPFFRFDHHTVDPLRVRGGLGYVLNDRVRIEFIYTAQFTRTDNNALSYTDNAFRLNIKLGLAKGILQRVFDVGDADE